MIGLTTQRLSHLVPHSILEDVKIENAAETAREWIQKIDPQTDLIILLTHQGRSADNLLATKIHGADIIVGSHSHTLLQQPVEVSGMLIVQTGSRCQFLGRLDMWVESDTISKYQYRLIPLVPSEGEDKSEFGLLVDEYKNRIDEEFGQVIGKLEIPWKRSRNQESNVGNFVSDVMRQKTKADFAVINSGAIRKNLNAGPIQTRDIYDLLPFENKLAVFRCTGGELLTLMRTNAKILNKPYDDMLQISGISYVVGKKESGKVKLVHPRINGQVIKSNQLYTGVTVDYILDGHAKKYFGFIPKQTELLVHELVETVIEAVQKHHEVHSEIQGRMR